MAPDIYETGSFQNLQNVNSSVAQNHEVSLVGFQGDSGLRPEITRDHSYTPETSQNLDESPAVEVENSGKKVCYGSVCNP